MNSVPMQRARPPAPAPCLGHETDLEVSTDEEQALQLGGDSPSPAISPSAGCATDMARRGIKLEKKHSPPDRKSPSRTQPTRTRREFRGAPPRKFSQEANINIDHWLLSLTQYLKSAGIEDPDRIPTLLSYLDESALYRVVHAKLEETHKNFASFVKAMPGLFARPEHSNTYKALYSQLQQSPSEEVADYAARDSRGS